MGAPTSADETVPQQGVVTAQLTPKAALNRRDLLTLVAASSVAGFATSDSAAAASAAA